MDPLRRSTSRANVHLSLLVVSLSLALAAANQPLRDLPSVPSLDLNRYSGAWFEIASSQFVYTTFQRGLVCTRANYTLRAQSGDVRVFNSGRKVLPNGVGMFADGRAVVKDPSFPGRISVAFGGMEPGSPNYYVIAVNDAQRDYEYALVGDPSRLSLWILARKPTLSLATATALVKRAEQVGFDIEAIAFKMSVQDSRCDYVTDPL